MNIINNNKINLTINTSCFNLKYFCIIIMIINCFSVFAGTAEDTEINFIKNKWKDIAIDYISKFEKLHLDSLNNDSLKVIKNYNKLYFNIIADAENVISSIIENKEEYDSILITGIFNKLILKKFIGINDSLIEVLKSSIENEDLQKIINFNINYRIIVNEYIEKCVNYIKK